MPTYTYKCSVCEHTFNVFHGMKDNNSRACPECQGEARRIISGGVGLIFKGSGFYITDYKGKNGSLNGNGNGNGEHSHPTATESNEAKSAETVKSDLNGSAKKGAGDKKSEKTSIS